MCLIKSTYLKELGVYLVDLGLFKSLKGMDKSTYKRLECWPD